MEDCMEDTDAFFTAIDHICAQHHQGATHAAPVHCTDAGALRLPTVARQDSLPQAAQQVPAGQQHPQWPTYMQHQAALQQPHMQSAAAQGHAALAPPLAPPPWRHQQSALNQHALQQPSIQQQQMQQQQTFEVAGPTIVLQPPEQLMQHSVQQVQQPQPLQGLMQAPQLQRYPHKPQTRDAQPQQTCNAPQVATLARHQTPVPPGACGQGQQGVQYICHPEQQACTSGQQQRLQGPHPQPMLHQQAALPSLQQTAMQQPASTQQRHLQRPVEQEQPKQQQQQLWLGQQGLAAQTVAMVAPTAAVATAAHVASGPKPAVDSRPTSSLPEDLAQMQRDCTTHQAKRPKLDSSGIENNTTARTSASASAMMPAQASTAAVHIPISSRGFATCGSTGAVTTAPMRPQQFYGKGSNQQQLAGHQMQRPAGVTKHQAQNETLISRGPQEQPHPGHRPQPAFMPQPEGTGPQIEAGCTGASRNVQQGASEHPMTSAQRAVSLVASMHGSDAPCPHPCPPPQTALRTHSAPATSQQLISRRSDSLQEACASSCPAEHSHTVPFLKTAAVDGLCASSTGPVFCGGHADINPPPTYQVAVAAPAGVCPGGHAADRTCTAGAVQQSPAKVQGPLKGQQQQQQQALRTGDHPKAVNRFSAFSCQAVSGHAAGSLRDTNSGPHSEYRSESSTGAHSGPSAGSIGDHTAANSAKSNGMGRNGPTVGAPAAATGRSVQPARGPTVFVDITPSLDSSTHVTLKANHLPEDMDKLLRSIQGSSFDAAREAWMVPTRQLHHARDQLQSLPSCHIKWVQDLPIIVQAVYRASGCLPDDSDRYNVLHGSLDVDGQSLDARMMQFQREGVQFALRHGGRVLIGDEMGLGKTVQGCALLRCYQDDWPALIVTPSSLRQQWADALRQWIGVLEIDVHVVFTKADCNKVEQAFKQRAAHKGRGPPPPLLFRLLVISYEYLDKMKETLQGLKFKCVLLDEAHMIKNFKAKRSQASVPLLQQARRAILLTGTPALSSPVELLPLLQAALPEANVRANDFADRYCAGNAFSKFKGSRNKDELHLLLSGTFMIRRRKAEVLKQLPPKTRQQIYLCLDDKASSTLCKQQEQLSHIKQLLGAINPHNTGGLLAGLQYEQQQAIMQLYHHTARLKIPAVQQYIKDMLEGDTKFLVFGHHHELLDGVEKQVNACKKKYIRIDGKTDGRLRDKLRAQFQEDKETQVAVLGITAAGVGLTLTAASTVVFAELSWVPGEILQAEDRVHRIGQESNVTIQFLLVRKSIDDIMWDTLQNKLSNIGKVLDGKQESLQVLSRVDVGGPPGKNKLDAYLQPLPKGQGGTGQPVDQQPDHAGPARAQQPAPSLQTAAQVAAGREATGNGAARERGHGQGIGRGSGKPVAVSVVGRQQTLDACFGGKADLQPKQALPGAGGGASASLKRIRDWGDDED